MRSRRRHIAFSYLCSAVSVLPISAIGTGPQSFYHQHRSVRISITATPHFSAQPARIVSDGVTRDIKHVGIIDMILAGMAMLHCPAGFHTVHFEGNLTDLQPGTAADMLEKHSLKRSRLVGRNIPHHFFPLTADISRRPASQLLTVHDAEQSRVNRFCTVDQLGAPGQYISIRFSLRPSALFFYPRQLPASYTGGVAGMLCSEILFPPRKIIVPQQA